MENNKKRTLHCIKRIAHLLGLLKEEMEDLCDALGIIDGKDTENASWT